MKYEEISLEELLSNCPPSNGEELKDFEERKQNLLSVKSGESEEYQKNILRDFLVDNFSYKCNTKERIDLSIYEDGEVRVLFEIKSLSNKAEFVSSGGTTPTRLYNLESKAFYESILHFLREIIIANNNNLTYIILTNTHDFYLIDAREYAQFAKDTKIKRAFDNCEKREGIDTSTQKFYDELKKYLPILDSTLHFTYFNLTTTPTSLLYQVLSPQVLLKQKVCIDANTLNQSFYDELLYILGLKEENKHKSKKKILIAPSTIPNTLLDSICKAFDLDRKKDFETIFSLLTTWNNRLLFLRLLESMLLSFKHIDKPFLDIITLKEFTDLNTLFFEVLAVKKDERRTDLKLKDSIPYLNSSLFDKTEIEKQNKEISKLRSCKLTIFKHSILKKDARYKNIESLSLLDYFFTFLHAYDFTTTPQDIINHTKINHDKLINAAVLGLVFEKLNGYKEGSFYTPSCITRYMCKKTLEKIVIEKFNIIFHSNAKTIKELSNIARNENKTTQDLRTILLSLKICDPSVGSGHFLVSALNEIVLIAYQLGILESLDFQTTLELDNEEIIIKKAGKILQYTKPDSKDEPQHKIQQELFNLKKEIIESCLFGVDINPNSCEITKLRLWIELLKYSYYIFENGRNTNTLETLPNIDINIKCGNSLVSRFDLRDSLNHIPNIKHQIAKYQKLVIDYKNANQNISNISKQEIEAQIEAIKQTFTLTLKDPKTKKDLEKAINTHIKNYGISLLDNESLYGLSYTCNIFGNLQLSKEQEEEAYISYGKIVALRKKLDSITSGESYKNAFEWRFAFPEVLNSDGDFLGFDLVIGNPPYIDSEHMVRYMQNIREIIKQKFKSTKGNWDIYIPFFERALEISNSLVIFITPNKWLLKSFGLELRKMICDNIVLIAQTGDVFDGAKVDSIVTFIDKNCKKHNIDFYLDNELINSIDRKLIKKDFALDYFSQNNHIIEAIKGDNIALENLAKCENACATADAYKLRSLMQDHNEFHNTMFKIVNTGTIGKYISKFGIKPMKYLKQSYQNPVIDKKIFIENFGNKYKTLTTSKKLIIKGLTLLDCCLDLRSEMVPAKSTLVITGEDEYMLKFLCAVINSKVAFYYIKEKYSSNSYCGGINFTKDMINSLPIPQIKESNKSLCDEVIKCVDKILKSKERDSNAHTQELESKIDSLVYQLYNLNNDEIQIIEN